MRSITANKLTHAYLERPARDNYIAIALTISILTLSVFWIAFRVGSDENTAVFTQITYGVSAFLGALWAFRTVYMAQLWTCAPGTSTSTRMVADRVGAISQFLWPNYLQSPLVPGN